MDGSIPPAAASFILGIFLCLRPAQLQKLWKMAFGGLISKTEAPAGVGKHSGDRSSAICLQRALSSSSAAAALGLEGPSRAPDLVGTGRPAPARLAELCCHGQAAACLWVAATCLRQHTLCTGVGLPSCSWSSPQHPAPAQPLVGNQCRMKVLKGLWKSATTDKERLFLFLLSLS